MQTRRIGTLEVSLAGIGCNNFGRKCDERQTAAVVNAALDAGVTLFDTADIYATGLSEQYLGAALGARRDEVVIATKFGMQFGEDPTSSGGSRRWIEAAVGASLKRLGTDRIDLYQMHRPDEATPIDETLEALDDLVRAGKVREIGHSNFSGAQAQAAADVAARTGGAPFVCAQNNWNLLARDVELDVVPACEKLGLAMLPYFPLASGLLTGKYRAGAEPPPGSRIASLPAERRAAAMSDGRLATVERLRAFAAEHDHSLLELAMSWLASQPVVASVIAGATTPEQVRSNASAVGWALSKADLEAIDAMSS